MPLNDNFKRPFLGPSSDNCSNPTSSSEIDERSLARPAAETSALSKKCHHCDICSVNFSRASNLLRHKRTVHGAVTTPVSIVKETPFKCRVCDSSFTNSANRRRHEKTKHDFDPEYKQELKCSECPEVFTSKNDIVAHLSHLHTDISMQEEFKVFQSKEEFVEWKLKVEKDTSTFYTLRYTNKANSYTVQHYICHRSGTFTSKSKGIRHLKIGGSNKTSYFCPAHIKCKTFHDKPLIEVSFLSCHLGHTCEVGRLRLTAPEKNKIAGVSIPVVSTSPSVDLQIIDESGNCIEIEKEALSKGFRKCQGSSNLKEEAKAALLALVAELETVTSDAQLLEVIKYTSIMKNNFRALAKMVKQLPPVVSKVVPSKNIEPQLQFPHKRRKFMHFMLFSLLLFFI